MSDDAASDTDEGGSADEEPGDAGPEQPDHPDLLELLVDEFRAGGIETVLVPATATFPAQLVVPIEHDDPDEHLRINTYFVPGVADPPALQYFVTFPYAVAEGAGPAMVRFLAALNANLPITGFEYAERAEVVVFRHTHAISIRPLDPGVIAWTWSMIRSAVVEFGALVRDVGAGADVDEALAAVGARLAELAGD